MIEFMIQLVSMGVELLPEALMSLPSLMATLTCGVFPSFQIDQSLFQGGSPLGYLRVVDGCFGKTVIGVQTKRK
jgi:hypothetical protein